ncbi:hypothetical protein DB30_04030 [Enhygromyxa salina]|uniref:DUF4331 domain-containing protein n=1 Tax=Enhygromyxa salina TaxID=215803 RepID=A0A0C2A0G7_9BACT|nr:DUF4331 family protein [Enhygromyxa salina]KIG16868.1 hypothetical protein DB30_04030 [Enhygromyxa salina]
MKRTIKPLLGVALLAFALTPGAANGADHADSPLAGADPAADISDLYAWHTEDDRLVMIVNFAGLGGAGSPGTYDADVLYGVRIDRDGDGISDHDIWVRFGQNGAGAWGVQVAGLPGEEPVEGPVNETLTSDGGALVFAGPREDPFFFDLDGFLATLDTGTLSFDASNDTFAGTNVTSIVIEADIAGIADGATNLSIWATAARKG